MTPNSEQQPQVQQQPWGAQIEQHAWQHRERQTRALEQIRTYVAWLLGITVALVGLALLLAMLENA